MARKLSDDQLPLMDAANAWSFNKKDIAGNPLPPAAAAAAVRFRSRLRQARRFTLDDEAVKLVCHLSHEFDRLEGWAPLARLPFDTLWIEFDLHTKLREFDAMKTLRFPFDPDQVSPRLGLLFYRDDPGGTSPAWVCEQFYSGNRAGFYSYPGMIAHVFDPEGDPMWPLRGSRILRSPTLSLLPDFPRAPVTVKTTNGFTVQGECDIELALCGIFELSGKDGRQIEVNKVGDVWHAEDLVRSPDWFTSRAATIVNPWWKAIFDKLHGANREKWYPEIGICAHEERGVLRWIMTLLAAINGLPRDIKPVATRPGKRSIGMNVLPYFQHHNLTITLPKDDRVVWARKTIDHVARNSRRPQHEVIGHWRIVERGKTIPYRCRHLPTMVENGLAMCERCEMMIRWIADHTRGDPTIGIIDQTRKVTAKRQTSPVELGIPRPTPKYEISDGTLENSEPPA